ncbi:MAG: NUDIX domain-containing protein, partial [Marmoricola sp.]
MGRTEYYDDPNAPTPNSLVPAATVFVQDDEGRVLMIQRSDNGLWALPGGVMEIGETLGQCAEREVEEETG